MLPNAGRFLTQIPFVFPKLKRQFAKIEPVIAKIGLKFVILKHELTIAKGRMTIIGRKTAITGRKTVIIGTKRVRTSFRLRPPATGFPQSATRLGQGPLDRKSDV